MNRTSAFKSIVDSFIVIEASQWITTERTRTFHEAVEHFFLKSYAKVILNLFCACFSSDFWFTENFSYLIIHDVTFCKISWILHWYLSGTVQAYLYIYVFFSMISKVHHSLSVFLCFSDLLTVVDKLIQWTCAFWWLIAVVKTLIKIFTHSSMNFLSIFIRTRERGDSKSDEKDNITRIMYLQNELTKSLSTTVMWISEVCCPLKRRETQWL